MVVWAAEQMRTEISLLENSESRNKTIILLFFFNFFTLKLVNCEPAKQNPFYLFIHSFIHSFVLARKHVLGHKKGGINAPTKKKIKM
ncbi:hypothetical protein CISIN_1g034703mg [Citrus sinensis]|uniref:Uncharacterized protein n=1 Tax=Citrus sinensis TaxID=2711 RepID=A0A067G023_CITSI|nr:hypothetical protein CISIN_1g034703mg [Citrus sinensis]